MKGVGEMLSSEVNGLTAMLLIRIKDEIKLAWDFNKELEDLQNEFTKLSWLIAGAPDKPMTNPLMGDWLNKIKEAVYNADNLLDEWSYDVLHLQIGSSTSSSCCDMDSLIRYPISRFLMGHKVRDLRKSISGIYDVAAKLGIQPIEVAAGETYSATMPSREILDQQRSLYDQRQCVDHELMVGRDRDIGDLVELLCHPSNTSRHLTVVGIVGFPEVAAKLTKHPISSTQEK
ncbi:putative disease resistance RPP13-like protein 1 [Bienertia sinuspersici]